MSDGNEFHVRGVATEKARRASSVRPVNDFAFIVILTWQKSRSRSRNDRLHKGANIDLRCCSKSLNALASLAVGELEHVPSVTSNSKRFFSSPRATVVERRSFAGELSLSCARPAADG